MRIGARTKLRRGIGVAVLAVAIAISAVVIGAGHGVLPAPRASALPRPPGVSLLVARAGGSQIDTAADPKRYRYMAIAGPAGWSDRQLLLQEVRYLLGHGWRHAVGWAVRGREEVLRRVPPTAPGARVGIDGPNNVDAGLEAVANVDEANQEADGSPIYGAPAMVAALRRHVPVALVTLGNRIQ